MDIMDIFIVSESDGRFVVFEDRLWPFNLDVKVGNGLHASGEISHSAEIEPTVRPPS
jgi:hypothetical protein